MSRTPIRSVSIVAGTTSSSTPGTYLYGFSLDEDAGLAATWTLSKGSAAGGQTVAIVSLAANDSKTVVFPHPISLMPQGSIYVVETTGSINGVVYLQGDGKQ